MAGVEMLRQNSREDALPLLRRNSSPVAATLLSLIVPGLGAAYNGQTSKAVVHFTLFASFFQMATITEGLPFFLLGVVGTWLFAVVDAGRTAQLLRDGLAPDAAEDVIARRLYGNPLAWSVTLVAIGTIFLLHTLLGVQLPVRQVLPIVLVVLGLYMMADYIHRRLRRERETTRFDAHRPPPSVISGEPLGAGAFAAGEIVTQVSAREVAPFPFDPRP